MIDVKFYSAKDKLTTKEDVFGTKTDLGKGISRLETRIEQGFRDQRKWMIILMLVCASLIVFVVKFT